MPELRFRNVLLQPARQSEKGVEGPSLEEPHHRPTPSSPSSSPNRLLPRCSAFTPESAEYSAARLQHRYLIDSSRKFGEPLLLPTDFGHRRHLGWEAVKTLRQAMSTTIEQ